MSEYAEHDASCPLSVVPCKHSNNGCPWTGPRHELEELHVPRCPYEAIKGFFAVNEARWAASQAENSLLRHRTQRLEESLELALRELGNARRALGPWWGVGTPGRISPSSSNSPANGNVNPSSITDSEPIWNSSGGGVERIDYGHPEGMAPQGRRLSDSNPSTSGEAPPPRPDETSPLPSSSSSLSYPTNDLSSGAYRTAAPNNNSADRTDIAAYFPSIDVDDRISPSGLGIRAQVAGHASSSAPSFQPRFPDMFSGSGPRTMQNGVGMGGLTSSALSNVPSLMHAAIAPIDLNSTLEAAFASLRGSVVRLAASVESLGRRQEISLTSETLRLAEEITSIRGVLHGLRMQVCSFLNLTGFVYWALMRFHDRYTVL